MPPSTKRAPADSSSRLVDHARRELRLVGEDPETIRGLCRVVQAFADMGHSGSSAHFASQYLDKLLRYQPLSDLTDDPNEWIDRHAEGLTTTPLWQSRRNSEAFSTDGGKTYTLLSEQEAAGDIATTPLHHSKETATTTAEVTVSARAGQSVSDLAASVAREQSRTPMGRA